MHWIITKDLINTSVGDTNRAGYTVLHSAPEYSCDPSRAILSVSERTPIIAMMTHEFRLFDDDGELYYEGLCKDVDQQESRSAFEPLDWAEVDVGATRMDYRKIGATEWVTL